MKVHVSGVKCRILFGVTQSGIFTRSSFRCFDSAAAVVVVECCYVAMLPLQSWISPRKVTIFWFETP